MSFFANSVQPEVKTRINLPESMCWPFIHFSESLMIFFKCKPSLKPLRNTRFFVLWLVLEPTWTNHSCRIGDRRRFLIGKHSILCAEAMPPYRSGRFEQKPYISERGSLASEKLVWGYANCKLTKPQRWSVYFMLRAGRKT